MKDQIVGIEREALARIAEVADMRGLEDARVTILGKKGILTLVQSGMRDVSKEDKPLIGQLLNEARKKIT
ncbi:MAG: phenylalanine--tRNA ligase subunit alpha, partial [Akkermansia sp.]